MFLYRGLALTPFVKDETSVTKLKLFMQALKCLLSFNVFWPFDRRL